MAGKHKGSSTKEGIEVTTLEQYLQLKKEGVEFDGQSYLFWEFVRIWKATKPKYFFLENVRVTKKWLPMFNAAMGVEPIMINSALVSAQNRVRFYWTNIPNITQPEDVGILFRDIINDSYEFKPLSKWVYSKWGDSRKLDMPRTIKANKSLCLTTNRSHSKNYYLNEDRTMMRMLGNGWTVDVITHIFKGVIYE